MNAIKYLLYALICLLAVNNVSAQYTNLKVGDSLGSGLVTVIAEDADYRWIGTTDGLWRIWKDRGGYVQYTKSNSILPSNLITSICCRKNHNVWVGTDNGIFWFDGVADILVSHENSKLPDLKITGITEDRYENLWVGTSKGGIMKLIGFHEIVYATKNSNLPDDHITGLSLSEDGDVILSFQQLPQIRASNLKHIKRKI